MERKRSCVEPRSVGLCRKWLGIKAKDLAEHRNRDPSMITRLYAADMENRDKRSESELQRRIKIKSTTFVRPHTPQPSFLFVQRFLPEFVVLTEQLRCPTTSAGSFLAFNRTSTLLPPRSFAKPGMKRLMDVPDDAGLFF
jgi:hypothetical protein